jgi:hypothetical protein
MNQDAAKKLEHLRWAVKSRARNQECAIRLLDLFLEYEDKWKTKDWSRAAQDLLSVNFSLWRAAFLADKTAKRDEVFAHAKLFLQRIIETNAISFSEDRTSKEWTFNYYTRNAKCALEALHEHWATMRKLPVPQYKDATRTPTEKWTYCQDLLDETVTVFEAELQSMRKKKNAVKPAKNPLSHTAKRRKVVAWKKEQAGKNPRSGGNESP